MKDNDKQPIVSEECGFGKSLDGEQFWPAKMSDLSIHFPNIEGTNPKISFINIPSN